MRISHLHAALLQLPPDGAMVHQSVGRYGRGLTGAIQHLRFVELLRGEAAVPDFDAYPFERRGDRLAKAVLAPTKELADAEQARRTAGESRDKSNESDHDVAA